MNPPKSLCVLVAVLSLFSAVAPADAGLVDRIASFRVQRAERVASRVSSRCDARCEGRALFSGKLFPRLRPFARAREFGSRAFSPRGERSVLVNRARCSGSACYSEPSSASETPPVVEGLWSTPVRPQAEDPPEAADRSTSSEAKPWPSPATESERPARAEKATTAQRLFSCQREDRAATLFACDRTEPVPVLVAVR